jgi:hypothetical protein
MSKNIHSKFSLILSVLLLLAGLPFTSARANSAPSADTSSGCYALDIVFIIDQSKSMKGIPSGPNQALANDPLGNRYYAPRYALDWLANNILGLCSQAVHRVGVVSFGTESQTDMPLTKIAPENQDVWNQVKEVLIEKIQPQDLDATNPAKAFEEASLILKAAPPLGDLPRKRAIIVLTDGKACVPTLGCRATGDGMDHEAYNQRFLVQVGDDFKFSEALRQQDEALRVLAQEYGSIGNIPDDVKNQVLRDYPVTPEDLQKSTYIWIVAMNSADPYLDVDGAALTQIAENHGGELIALPENRIAVPSKFNEILSWLSGISPTILSCGKLAVDPYLGGATLDVYKAGEGFELTITHNGKTLVGGEGDREYFGVKDYSQFGVIEHYRFEKPPAGLWQVDASDCQSVEVSYIPFRSQVNMIAPLSTVPNYSLNDSTSDPAHPFYLEYKIMDVNGNLTLDDDPLYPLDMKAIIGLPDGSSQEAQFTSAGAGVWKSSAPIPVHLIGTYTVDLGAHASCVENPDLSNSRCEAASFLVVQDAAGKYEVGNVDLFDFKILNPADGDVLPLHGNIWPERLALQPIDVMMQLVDSNGNPLSASAVLTGELNNAFEATLVAASGESQSMIMQPDAMDPSRYAATFASPAVLGEHTVTIKLLSDYRFETHSPARNQVSIVFRRQDSLLRNPTFYTLLGILLVILLAMFVVSSWLGRRNAVKGRLTLTDPSTNLSKAFSLSQKKRVVTLSQGLLPGVARVTVTNAGARAGKQMIKVSIKPSKGAVVTKTLIDGTEIPVSANLKAKYEWGGRPIK